jgi:diacylglycerol kinase (ATP)
MAGIGVVLNPRSRHNLRDPAAVTRLARALGDHGVVRAARSREDLARIAEDFRKLKIDVLGISGGDGTNHITLTGFLQVYADEPLPPIAFLRGGTMNNVANALGVPRGRPDGLLASLIARYNERQRVPLRLIERHVMRIGEHYGFIFGTGAIHGYMSAYYSVPEPNTAHAARVLLEASAKVITGQPTSVAERWRGRVTLDGGSVTFPERDYLSIGAGTVDQIGLGFRPFYRCDHAPGRFHILGIHTSAFGFVQKLPDIWRARPMGPGHTYDHLAEHAVLEAQCGVVRYTVDGDLHAHQGPLEIRTGPRVRIIVEHKPGIRPMPLPPRFARSR